MLEWIHKKALTGQPKPIDNQEFMSMEEFMEASKKMPGEYPKRFFVKPEQVSWTTDFPEYMPKYFVDNHVLFASKNIDPTNKKYWADFEDVKKLTDADLSRIKSSFTVKKSGPINFTEDGRPMNPMGRTGIEGRGQLGKWGPNKAGDAVIFRDGENPGDEMQVLIVQRPDGQWAIPGGMVDSGEKAIESAFRELFEETVTQGGDLSLEQEELKKEFMKGAVMVDETYVDDERNTDNAWMETSIFKNHISRELSNKLHLKQETAKGAKPEWVNLSDPRLKNLFASHTEFLEKALK